MTKWVNKRKSGGWDGAVYHTDENCRYLNNKRKAQPNEIPNKNLSECDVCAGEIDGHDGGDKSIYEMAKRIGEQEA